MTLYTFKYLSPNENVYVIKKRAIHGAHRGFYYSEPYKRGDVRNVVLAYKDKTMIHSRMKEIMNDMEVDIYVDKVQLIDLEGYCAELQMPLNVVLNEYCDVSDRKIYKEIFYFENKVDDEYTTKKLYMK